MAEKTRVLLLMGGVSGEHAISVRSAASLAPAITDAGFELVTVGITPSGRWLWGDFRPLLERSQSELVSVDETAGTPVTLANVAGTARLVSLAPDAAGDPSASPAVDVVFPITHGPGGEDGKLQGLLDSVGVPYVGAGCAASAIAMDKLAMKTLCDGAGIAQVEYLVPGSDSASRVADQVEAAFGYPCFVKPANLGSSVGITRVDARDGMAAALAEARRWDDRIVIERGIEAREIELALLGDVDVEISPPGEIITGGEFYDFDQKYVDEEAGLVAPAEVPSDALAEMHAITKKVWKLLGCRGLSRADFFLEIGSGAVFFNEINTLPGFTSISMYPRLWREAGLDMPQLVKRLVDLALGETQAAGTTAQARAETRT